MHCINFSVASLCKHGCLLDVAVIKAAAYGDIDEFDGDATTKYNSNPWQEMLLIQIHCQLHCEADFLKEA